MPPLLTADQVAAHLGVTRRTLRRWAADGHLQPVIVGPRTLRYRADEIAALIDPGNGSSAAGERRSIETTSGVVEEAGEIDSQLTG